MLIVCDDLARIFAQTGPEPVDSMLPASSQLTGRDPEAVALRQRLETLEGVLSVHGIHVPGSSQSEQDNGSGGMLPPSTSRLTVSPGVTSAAGTASTRHDATYEKQVTTPHLVRQSSHVTSLTSNVIDSPAIPASYDLDEGPTIPQSEVHSVHFDFSGDSMTVPSSTGNHISPSDDTSFGTLAIGRGGRSKWLGPTAASEWLRDVRTSDGYADRCSKRHKRRAPLPDLRAGRRLLGEIRRCTTTIQEAPCSLSTMRSFHFEPRHCLHVCRPWTKLEFWSIRTIVTSPGSRSYRE